MKKSISALIIILCMAVVVPAQGQIKFGVKGGLNLASSLSDAWDDKTNTDSYTGFFIGPMVDIGVPVLGLGVDGALLFSQKGNKVGEEKFKQQGLEIPLNLKYSFGLGSLASVYLAAGPSFFFNMRSDEKVTFESIEGSIRYKNAEVGINLGGGVRLLKHLQVGINYHMPLTDSAKAEVSDGADLGDVWDVINGKSYKTKMWQVSVAYIF